MELGEVRDRLSQARGAAYWRTLQELADADEFHQLVEREFPSWAAAWEDAPSRRQFLKIMAASFALAGVAGCGGQPPREEILPYVRQPEGVVPGRPQYYATAMPLAGYATGGLLVKSHLGRPVKVEGNPQHPGSLAPQDAPEHGQFGPSDVFAQASVLSLYDPDRSQAVTYLGQINSWNEFLRILRSRLGQLPRGGEGLCVLTGAVTSPTFATQMEALTRRYPAARWYVHEPVSRDAARAGAMRVFGQAVEPRYHFDRAEVILSLGSDFLNAGPGHLRYTRDFMAKRRQPAEGGQRNRLYVVESTPSGTGARADHRLPLRPAQMEAFAAAVAQRLGVQVPERLRGDSGVRTEWIQALADDLTRRPGRGVVVAGEQQTPLVQTLAHAMNVRLNAVVPGNEQGSVSYLAPIQGRPEEDESGLEHLVDRLQNDDVRVLLILGSNPAYTAPADVPFASAVQRAGLVVHVGLYQDETAAHAHWHIPEAHYLESWGDVRAFDGTVSLIQPLIAPLHGGRSTLEVLAALTGEMSGQDLVRAHWRQRGFPDQGSGGFERAWRRALHDGWIEGSGSAPQSVTLRDNWADGAELLSNVGAHQVILAPDDALFDGQFANNGWLQELPQRLSKLTWDNAAYLSPATAVRLGLAPSAEEAERANGQELQLTHQERHIVAPAWARPGHADDCVTVHLGRGRTRAGRVGDDVGFSAYALRTSGSPWLLADVSLRPLGRRRTMATTQTHHLMENRDLVRHGTFAEPPHAPGHAPRQTLTLYEEHRYDGNKWGMAIDLSACTGCGACVVACQAENNIPVVGKDQVARGREMHWLRIDSYYHGASDNPQTFFQPVPCMHCENAPCEVVCPVMATVHSSDGLNDMVYNRCVGTRYCSNNCPYKVRRFNFLQYADFETPSLQLLRNPEVTVRSRGVMEKCTYCVQRIRTTQIQAAREDDRRIRDGEVQTACQSACPARAIVFGDLNHRGDNGRPLSKVAQMQDDPLNYGLLADLNTRPRTTYLPALSNPNPQMPAQWRAV
jgi:MoCo/4Fe-4S cofactor protein with predicted Tat translocation signal